MQSFIDLLIRSRGQNIRRALEVAPQNTRERKQTIDYLRAIVPLHAVIFMVAGLLVGLRYAAGIRDWYHYLLMAIALWYFASSAAIFTRARSVLRSLK